MTVPKPLVLLGACPVYGHVTPIRAIGKELVARGYDVTFITGSAYKESIEAIGAKLIPLEGRADYTEANLLDLGPLRDTIPQGPEQVAYDVEQYFVNSIPGQHAAQQKALKQLSEEYPGRPIVMAHESLFLGAMPGLLGAPGLKPTAVIGIGLVPVALRSMETACFGPGLPPDNSPAGRARNMAMNKGMEEMFAVPQNRFEEILTGLGVKQSPPFVLDVSYLAPDRFLQMCIPSVEYPRSDAPATMHFAGGLPRGHRDPFVNPPSWWHEVTRNTTKRIVAVSQGSLALKYSDLIIPTMNALKGFSDVLVVVALGKKGATLLEGTVVPENARVADFIPFDDLLPHCAVFVTNGGYGAFQHAISNGTPLVIAGVSEDKPEVAARAEWAGIGINLRTGSPSVEQVRSAVVEVFDNDRYKARCRELEEEMKGYDPIEVVERSIQDLAAAAN